MTGPSVCRACRYDQHHRCAGWCGCPLAHATTTPAPKATRKPTTARPARARRAKTSTPQAPKPEPVAAPAPTPRRYKPRHRRQPIAVRTIDHAAQRETALAFLDANSWSPAALQLLAAVDGHPLAGTDTAA